MWKPWFPAKSSVGRYLKIDLLASAQPNARTGNGFNLNDNPKYIWLPLAFIHYNNWLVNDLPFVVQNRIGNICSNNTRYKVALTFAFIKFCAAR